MAAGDFVRGDITLGNWRSHPFSRYSFQHVPEFVPVAEIRAGSDEPEPSRGASGFPAGPFRGPDGSTMSTDDYLIRSHADCVVAMRDGRILAEWNGSHADPARPHVVFSISKSITALLAGIAVEAGQLDPDRPVVDYLPGMAASAAYAAATVRHLLDMTVALDFDEEYLDTGGPFDRYRRAMLWNPEPPGASPETMEQFLATLGASAGEHGTRFYYASPNTDLLGLVVERAAGLRYHLQLAGLLEAIGARGGAHVTVDRAGTARAAGGVCVTARDLARIGQLVMDEGRNSDGRQVVPRDWIADLRENGDRAAWQAGNFADMFENGSYRSCWYSVGDGRGTFCAVGIHGQWLWCDPTSRIVIAKTGSRPDASDDDATAMEIHMLAQLAQAFDQPFRNPGS